MFKLVFVATLLATLAGCSASTPTHTGYCPTPEKIYITAYTPSRFNPSDCPNHPEVTTIRLDGNGVAVAAGSDPLEQCSLAESHSGSDGCPAEINITCGNFLYLCTVNEETPTAIGCTVGAVGTNCDWDLATQETAP